MRIYQCDVCKRLSFSKLIPDKYQPYEYGRGEFACGHTIIEDHRTIPADEFYKLYLKGYSYGNKIIINKGSGEAFYRKFQMQTSGY